MNFKLLQIPAVVKSFSATVATGIGNINAAAALAFISVAGVAVTAGSLSNTRAVAVFESLFGT